MATIETDVCIIGAGSGGLSAAAGIAQLGLKTVLIERDEMGGDCLNTGCVPSKALIAAADRAHLFNSNKFPGIKSHPAHIDFAGVKDHVQNSIQTIAPHDSQERFEGLGVHVIRDDAVFISPSEIRASGDTIKARYYIIATGARPRIPMIPGISMHEILTNEDIFELRERPEHLVIIGGGPVGVEMAQTHRRLGCDVTLIEKGCILPHDDRENVSILRGALLMEKINLMESSTIKSAEKNGAHYTLTVSSDSEIREINCTHIMAAAGRTPNIETLGLDRADIKFDKNGVHTDRRLRTSQKHIFAIGDVTHEPKFTHVAGYHAGIVLQNICFKMPAKVNYSALPWVTYCKPELAQAGMTEETAIEKYGNKIVVTTSAFANNDRAVTQANTKGQIKVISKKNGRILGASIIGPQAGELISLWSLAISQKMKLKDVAGMITPYPTLSEINKRVAGSFYTEKLFSKTTQKIVRYLQKLPF